MTSVTKFPTAVETGGEDPFDWTNPTNAFADDDVDTTAILAGGGGASNNWKTFGFDASIPAGSTITAVKLIFEAFDSVGGYGLTLHAIVGGVAQTDHSQILTNVRTVYTIDITADWAWTRADLLDAAFKVWVHCGDPTDPTSYDLDYIKVQVDYTSPSTPINATDSAAVTETPTILRREYPYGSKFGGLLLDLYFPYPANIQLADAATAADLVSDITTLLAQNDIVTATDAVASLLAILQQSDSISVADVVASILAQLTLSDAVSIADAVAIVLASLSATDTATAIDVVSSIQATLALVDSGVVADALSDLTTVLATGDAAAINDVLDAIAAQLILTDTATVAETIDVTIVDSIPITAADIAAVAEAVEVLILAAPLQSQGPWRKLDPNWIDELRARQRRRNKIARRLLF